MTGDDLESQGSRRKGEGVVIPLREESIFQCHVYRQDVVDLTFWLIDLRIDRVMCLDSSEMFSCWKGVEVS
jgi:hypothetical protein